MAYFFLNGENRERENTCFVLKFAFLQHSTIALENFLRFDVQDD